MQAHTEGSVTEGHCLRPGLCVSGSYRFSLQVKKSKPICNSVVPNRNLALPAIRMSFLMKDIPRMKNQPLLRFISCVLSLILLSFLNCTRIDATSIRQFQSSKSDYQEITRIPIGSGGANPVDVAVNPVTNTLYVLNQSSATISIIDGATGKLLGSIPIIDRISLIEIIPETNSIYVAGQQKLYVFDSTSGQLKTRLEYPPLFFLEYMVVNPKLNRIYLGVSSGSIVVVDGNSNSIIQTISVTEDVSGLAVNLETSQLYVTNADSTSNELVIIDGNTHEISRTIKLPGTSFISGLAVNPATNRAYVTNLESSREQNSLVVIDIQAGSIVTKMTVPHATREILVNQASNLVYLLTSDFTTGFLAVIDGGTNTITNRIPTGRSFSGRVGFNPQTNHVYLPNLEANTVSDIDVAAGKIVADFLVGNMPTGIDVNSQTNTIYLTNLAAHTVTILDGATNQVTTSVAVGKNPIKVVVNEETNRIYVLNQGDNSISVIDGNQNQVIGTIAVGNFPQDLGINSKLNRLYVVQEYSQVAVIDTITEKQLTTIEIDGARGITVNPTNNRIYVSRNVYLGLGNGIIVVDGNTHEVIITIPVQPRCYPEAVVINPQTNRIYAANNPEPGSIGGFMVFDGNNNTLITRTEFTVGLYEIDVNQEDNLVFLACGGFGVVYVIDGVRNKVLSSPRVGLLPIGVRYNARTKRLYVTNQVSDSVSVLATDGTGADTQPPTLRLVSPNGGEVVKAGQNLTIQWQSSDNTGVVSHDILLSSDEGATYTKTIATGLPGNIQSFDFLIPLQQPKTKRARIRVMATDVAGNKNQAESARNFKIKKAKS